MSSWQISRLKLGDLTLTILPLGAIKEDTSLWFSGGGGPDPTTGIDSLDMLAALGELDPDDRTLLALRYGLGYDATELSAVTGISPAGTRQRLKRLLDRLRQELE